MKSKLNYAWLLLLVIIFTSQGIFAQTKITGTVKDGNGLLLPGATVIQKGTQNGVLTDVDGNYSITLKEDGEKSLIFSFIGFLPQEFLTRVHAGMFVGWLHKPVALIGERSIGRGQVLACTLNLAAKLPNHPLAAYLVKEMITYLQ